MQDPVADRLQFELQELRDRVDVLVIQMNDFREEAMRLLKTMGGSIVEASVDTLSTHPEVAPVLHPAPEAPSNLLSAPEPLVEPRPTFEIPELNLSSGLTAGPARRN